MERKMRHIATLLMLLFVTCVYAQEQQRPTITVDNVSLLKIVSTIEVGSPVRTVMWSADGKLLAIQLTTEEIYIYDFATGNLTPFVHEGIRAFIEGNGRIRIISENTQSVIDITTTEVLFEVPLQEAISSDGTLYAVLEYTKSEDAITSETIGIYDTETHNLIHNISVNMDERGCVFACLPSLYFNLNNDKLVFLTCVPDVESAIVDIATGDKTPLNRQNIFCLSSVVFHPDGQIFAATSGNPGYLSDAIQFYNLNTGDIVASIDVYASSLPAFSPDSDLIAVGAFDEMAPNPDESIGYLYFFKVSQLLEAGSGDIDSVLYGTWSNWLIADIEFSPQGNLVAVEDNAGTVSIWGIPTEP